MVEFPGRNNIVSRIDIQCHNIEFAQYLALFAYANWRVPHHPHLLFNCHLQKDVVYTGFDILTAIFVSIEFTVLVQVAVLKTVVSQYGHLGQLLFGLGIDNGIIAIENDYPNDDDTQNREQKDACNFKQFFHCSDFCR